jgi:MipA family protein
MRAPAVTVSLSIAALSLHWIVPVSAQEFGPPPNAPMSESFELMLGLGAANAPAYLGSDERRTRALPLVAARWRNGWFAGTGGVGYRFPGDAPLTGGLRLGFDLGRDENDAEALRGMGDIEPRPEIGAFASYRFAPFLSLTSSVRFGSGNDRDGAMADLGLRGVLALGERHRMFAGVTATFGNEAAMQSQFGVSLAQAASSGYSVYEPEAGLRDLNLSLGYGYVLTPGTTIQGGVNIRNLFGDAKDSPLTRDASGVSANLTLSFRL